MQTRVRDIMTRDTASVAPGTSFKDVAETLIQHGLNAVPVVDDHKRVVGVVSEADLLPKEEFKEQYVREGYQAHIRSRLRRHLSPGGGRNLDKMYASTAADLMTAPAITVRPQQTVVNAMRLTDESGIMCLPVVDDHDRLVGILSRHDLIKVFVRTDKDLADEIQRDLNHFAWVDTSRVHAKVEDGVVTLQGRTRTHSDAVLIAHSAIRVNGVVDVRDELLWDEDDL
ncbi:CBS domain-containing protein [Nonomuraea sp. CA-141351]|uniref:CBS domain-containing protein n=1 Tax=Nonomuraea sp. CA-141351 TaxID=3239996 RepID=UPI003D90AE13